MQTPARVAMSMDGIGHRQKLKMRHSPPTPYFDVVNAVYQKYMPGRDLEVGNLVYAEDVDERIRTVLAKSEVPEETFMEQFHVPEWFGDLIDRAMEEEKLNPREVGMLCFAGVPLRWVPTHQRAMVKQALCGQFLERMFADPNSAVIMLRSSLGL